MVGSKRWRICNSQTDSDVLLSVSPPREAGPGARAGMTEKAMYVWLEAFDREGAENG